MVVAKSAGSCVRGVAGVALGTGVSFLASSLSPQVASLRPRFGISEDKLSGKWCCR